MSIQTLLQRFQTVFLPLAVLVCLPAVGSIARAAESQTFPNPHWTGKHCTECHVEAGKKQLRFEHDVNQVCLRCHFKNSSAGSELHPVGVPLREDMQGSEGAAWPVGKAGLSCLTCHAVPMQMYADTVKQQSNPKFLRGGATASVEEFCFKCHQEQLFRKVNPHIQLTADGEIRKNVCLFCHEHPPDADLDRVRATGTLKSTRSGLCTGCHDDLKAGHRAHADLKAADAERKQGAYMLRRFEPALNAVKETKLPLVDGAIHCATCHNPHEAGVLTEEHANAGAGKPYFLRTDKVIVLCIFCHAGKDAAEKLYLSRTQRWRTVHDGGMSFQHNPWKRKECKACHAIDPGNEAARDQRYACMRTGCHEATADRFTGDFRHFNVGEHTCTICHKAHTSAHERLLTGPEREVCRTCHPQIGAERRIKTSEPLPDRHAEYGDLFEESGIDADSGCVFCHFINHRGQADTIPFEICFRCHGSIGDVRSRAAQETPDPHQSFNERRCTACHEPHAAEYRYLLKSPRETYIP